MKISFMQSNFSARQNNFQSMYKHLYGEKEQKRTMRDLKYSVAAGAIAGVITAGTMFKNNKPRILLNSLEIASVVSGFSYILSLITDKFYKK